MLVYFIDGRYASAADLFSLQEQIDTRLGDGTKQVLEFQIQQLDDQIFQLQLRQRYEGASEMDTLMIERYKSNKTKLENQLQQF